VRPHRLQRYMASTDPDFESKAADIIGLYLHPPQHPAIFCVDEKTAVQDFVAAEPLLPLSPVGPSIMASSTTGTARFRCMPHSIVVSLLCLLQRFTCRTASRSGPFAAASGSLRTSLDLIVALFLRVEYAAQAASNIYIIRLALYLLRI
jgi:hypothetical protein